MNNKEMKTAQVILDQLGGDKFVAITGVYDIAFATKSLHMRLPENKSKARALSVFLVGDDYIMKFWKTVNTDIVYIADIDGVHRDQLQAVFTDVTGLDTHL